MRWILLVLLAPLPAFSLGVEDLMNHYMQDLWHVGKGLSPGDSFLYFVCGPVDSAQMCYEIRLDLYVELESQGRQVWIVQAEIGFENVTGMHVFLVDSETLDITTDRAGGPYADSVSGTVFHLDRFAHSGSPKHLGVGEYWGDVTSSLNIGTDLRVTSHDTTELQDGTVLDISVLEYGYFEKSVFAVSGTVPFPVAGLAYDPYWTRSDPPVLFSFELLEYDASSDPLDLTE